MARLKRARAEGSLRPRACCAGPLGPAWYLLSGRRATKARRLARPTGHVSPSLCAGCSGRRRQPGWQRVAPRMGLHAAGAALPSCEGSADRCLLVSTSFGSASVSSAGCGVSPKQPRKARATPGSVLEGSLDRIDEVRTAPVREIVLKVREDGTSSPALETSALPERGRGEKRERGLLLPA